MKFADKMKMGKRFESISLGQGQGPLAENMMRIGCDFGNWVFFQVNYGVDFRKHFLKLS